MYIPQLPASPDPEPLLFSEFAAQGARAVPPKPSAASPGLLDLAIRDQDATPVRWREVLSVLLLVALADVTVYRGHGFAGIALLFVAAPVVLLIAAPRRLANGWTVVMGLLLTVLAGRLVWSGSMGLVALGGGLLVAYAMTLSRLTPYVLEVAVFASQTFLAGFQGLVRHGRFLVNAAPKVWCSNWINFILPLATFVAFSMLFILANPDVLKSFSERASQVLTSLRDWLVSYSPSPGEVFFWVAMAWLAIGLLRPVVGEAQSGEEDETYAGPIPVAAMGQSRAPLYPAFRNTLVLVIVLFAMYLAFEYQTLWFRVFPRGFHYSGYAHEGAAWLTVALALATAILSLVFRGAILADPRLSRLRSLAWIWSFENLLLAAAVYHRLLIYVGFNGMSRMRVIGFFGISTVVVGFLLVLWKIGHERRFLWLMRRHLWALAAAIYLFLITPVDMLVVSYNVRRILSGDPAPSVQISVHPIGAEGILLLPALLDCRDEAIRNGIRAMLAERHQQADELARRREQQGWTSFQIADVRLLRALGSVQSKWTEFKTSHDRAVALETFHKYAYQWY